jgi:GT2 family glycosyltransferase
MISVIIVNYHSAPQTEKAVQSVLGSAEEQELIVVDNTCSTDERRILGKMQDLYGFALILNEKNTGFAGACNQAFSRTTGEYVFLLNPDAFVIPPCLTLLREFLENTPLAGSVSPQVYWDDEMQYFFPRYSLYSPFQDFCSRLSSLSQRFRTLYSLVERSKNVGLWRSLLPVRVKNLHGGVVMVRRSAAKKAGGLFDERFFLFFEDTDLFFRLRKGGHSLYIIPEAKAVHNHAHSQKKVDTLSRMSCLYREKHFGRNLLPIITSHIPEGNWKGAYNDYGHWDVPPSFPVPELFHDGYLFEWSPNPVFVPSIGCFGRGAEFSLSRQVWDLLDKGRYYVRFTPSSRRVVKYAVGYWEKEI